MMNMNSVIIFFVLMSVMSSTWADDDVTSSTEKSSHRNWHFNANIAYTSRTLSGTIANQTGITDNVFGDLVATGDSMNVDSSNGVMLALSAQYKRWGMGLTQPGESHYPLYPQHTGSRGRQIRLLLWVCSLPA